MSRERRRSTDPRAAVREQREHQRRIRHKRRPCGALPAVPTGLVGEFITRGRTRHERLLLRARWDEVTQDDAGNPIKVDGYNLEVEFSDDLGATWERHSRHKIPAKADDDPNTWAQAIVHRIRKRPRYRYRFRVEAFKGECRSGYSAFTPALSPTDSDAPPAPTNVRIFDKGVDRVVIRWDPPTDPDDPEMLHEDVQHFAAEISKFSDFSVIYDRDRYITKSRVAFKVDDADAGDTFYGRAWSVDESRNRSPKIPATKAGNSLPGTPPDGVTIGKGGGKDKPIFSVRGRLRVLAEADSHELDIDEALTIRKVRARVKQAPTGADVIIKVWKNNTTLVATVTIAAGTKRGVQDGLSVAVADADVLSVEIAQVGTTFPGKHLTVKVVME